MKLLTVLLALSLSACSTFKLNQDFPTQSELLLKDCPALELIPEDTTKLSEAEKVIAANYQKYHQCRNQNRGWIDWYNKQKANH